MRTEQFLVSLQQTVPHAAVMNVEFYLTRQGDGVIVAAEGKMDFVPFRDYLTGNGVAVEGLDEVDGEGVTWVTKVGGRFLLVEGVDKFIRAVDERLMQLV